MLDKNSQGRNLKLLQKKITAILVNICHAVYLIVRVLTIALELEIAAKSRS